MDVRSRNTEDKRTDGAHRGPAALAPRAYQRRPLAEVLGEWQTHELRVARGFRECRGLSAEQLEDIYQDTTLALLRRPYQDEEHLRNALRTGLKHRALNVHRNERRRGEILTSHAPELQLLATVDEGENSPENVALVRQGRAIVSEFLTELTAMEQRVFWLISEGMQYRAIAPVLGIATNEARNASRSCERKRERFQLLYDTGRLCGFRANTIHALQSGQTTSEEQAERAFAHLESCAHCRAEHKTNAKRLRRSFQGQAAALLPLPALTNHLGWLTRLDLRFRGLQHRLPFMQGGLRERTVALLAGGGATAKIATSAVTVAVIAGGTIGATHALEHPKTRHHHSHAAPRPAPQAPVPAAVPADLAQAPATPLAGTSSHHTTRSTVRPHRTSPAHSPLSTRHAAPLAESARREPGGFAFLGVPTGTRPSAATTASAHPEANSTGGPFSP